MKHLEVITVQAHATSGSSVSESMRDAISLAVAEWRNIEFKHNETVYRVNVNDLLSVVQEVKAKTK